MRPGSGTASLFVLGLWICSGPRADSNLEDKAKDGDATAACELAVQDLSTCMTAWKEWTNQPGSVRPACIDKPVPDSHREYLKQAVKPLIAMSTHRWSARAVEDGVAMAAKSIQQNTDKRAELESLIESIANACPELRV